MKTIIIAAVAAIALSTSALAESCRTATGPCTPTVTSHWAVVNERLVEVPGAAPAPVEPNKPGVFRTADEWAKTGPEVISFTANDLFDAYDRNEVAADISLKGKIVDVMGRVQSVNKDAFDSIYVSLVTRNQFMSATMYVVKPLNWRDMFTEEKMAALQKGQLVVFRCLKMRKWFGSPSGSDCILLSAED
jgi:hypothetical protein